MQSSDDTIVAVSSPPGRSARGLVRISGPTQEVLAILGQLLEPPGTPSGSFCRVGYADQRAIPGAAGGLSAGAKDQAIRQSTLADKPPVGPQISHTPQKSQITPEHPSEHVARTQAEPLQAWPTPRQLVATRIQLPVRSVPVDAIPSQIAPMSASTPTDSSGELSLPVLLLFFMAPRSYTGQSMVEIQCPGNPVLLERVVSRVVELGARRAEPGEFTFRAYLAGKMDLTQAEGVAATIAAVSDGQLRAATLLREGELGRFTKQLIHDLAGQLALVEAGIDFTDQEDVVPIAPRELHAGLVSLCGQLDGLLTRSRSWSTVEALAKVVLVGLPSVGKSTLFNALLGRRRTVVMPTPGTTRDVIAEQLTLVNDTGGRVEVMLVDLAGLDSPQDALDRQVQAAARRAINEADLILHVTAPAPATGGGIGEKSTHSTCEDRSLHAATGAWPFQVDWPKRVPVLHIRAKADLGDRCNDSSLSDAPSGGQAKRKAMVIAVSAGADGDDVVDDVCRVSGLTGMGMDRLRRAILHHVGKRGESMGGQMLVLGPRHETALGKASTRLHEAIELLTSQIDATAIQRPELVASCLREAMDLLAGLGGQVTRDDVIGRVFATFCVGK